MIIDTTCSVIESKMKEVIREQSPEQLLVKEEFKVSDFVVNTNNIDMSNITVTMGSAPVVFSADVVFLGYNGEVWNTMLKTTNWDIPISKANGSLAGLENDDHLQYFLN